MIGKQRKNRTTRSSGRPLGFTLIELMVAMLLGLIVIGGVTSVFLAGQQTYRTNESLGEVGDESRTAFEMLARDIRDAGNTGCDTSSGRVANVVNPPDPWYANWNDALLGYDDATTDPALTGITGAGAPTKNSSVHVLSTANTDIVVSKVPSGSAASFEINAATTELATGDLIMVCDFDHATIMQITKYNSDQNVVHDSGGNATPGNCSKGLGYPTICTGPATGNQYTFPANSRVAVLTSVVWYIGKNGANTNSLYRLDTTASAGGVTATPQEMVRNVNSMKIAYLQPPGTSFTTATNVTNWAIVNSAQITLQMLSTNTRVDTTGTNALNRSFTSTTTVRNRVQ
ncbi:prepilin-type N-terminal cleavage/methylation domain-containing protein [Dyella sp. 2HG41-7]|uniref:prepilin-type N-terminal cleavage/methylation domain-containing protein n=1 Tax=Dyella sp. 2HG41-7 TaxID=2883239 RepID=UPI001F28735D|nr:prepilin-type N-terminal cleavage/methylation domain-containing protein [Dyella sp. 2HG41-7]